MKKFTLLAFIFLLVGTGCAKNKANQTDGDVAGEGKKNIPLISYPVDSVVSSKLSQNPVLKVAILPPTLSEAAIETTEKWDDVNAPALFRTVFFGRFSVLPYKDISIQQVDSLLSQNGIESDQINKASSKRLSQLLGVNALIYIHLTEVENVNTTVHARTEYAATLTMIDAETSEELWRTTLKQNTFGGLIGKGSQLADFVAFEKANRNRPLAFRKVAESWSHRVIADLREKLNE